ncbi:hypothetical protein ACFQFH_18475 [Halobaculum halobium]|uniref:hypothetical protein n=1 Tax=Halobaculum halobium TaxID=3032281 RepID=UPI00361EC554
MTTDESTLAGELRADGIDVADVRVSPERVAVAYTTTLPGNAPPTARWAASVTR